MREAWPRIREDLQRLRQRRARALMAYLALLAMFTGLLFRGPTHAEPGVEATWYAGLVGLFVGAAASAALAIGVPLLHGRKLAVALGGSLVVMLGGLGVALDYNPNEDWMYHGPTCFTFGTVVSGLFMIILGALSGRLWRRFPDPGAMVALGTTAVGMLALHMRCESANAIHVLLFHLTPLAILFAGARVLTRFRLRLLEAQGQD